VLADVHLGDTQVGSQALRAMRVKDRRASFIFGRELFNSTGVLAQNGDLMSCCEAYQSRSVVIVGGPLFDLNALNEAPTLVVGTATPLFEEEGHLCLCTLPTDAVHPGWIHFSGKGT
jgi:hypothetical protein